MELKELCEKTLKLFDCGSIDDLGDKLLKSVLNGDIQAFDDFVEMVGDLSIDYLQKIFQYYQADRKEKNRTTRQRAFVNCVQGLQKQAAKSFMIFVQVREQ